MVDDEGIGDEGTAEDTTGLEVGCCVGVGKIEESGPEIWREKDRP